MPTVLLLYPGTVTFRVEQGRRYRGVLRELGVRLVLADDYLTDEDREVFDELVLMPECDRVEEGWQTLRRRLAAGDVDAILAQSEGALLLGALASRELGVPGVRPESALLTVSKALGRRALQDAGVPQPRFALARSAADVRAFARAEDGPVVVKGTASALGRLVSLVREDGEIDAAVARMLASLPRATDIVRLSGFAKTAGIDLGYDPAREFLVESFSRGLPVETDGVLSGAEPLSFGVVEQVLSPPPLFFLEGYLLPADRTPAEIDAIERVSDRALAALGLTDTGYSIEMRLRDGGPEIIEVNGRLGWDAGFGDLFEVRTGIQPVFACLQVALGIRPELARGREVRCAVAYRSFYGDGIVRRLPSAAESAEVERDGFRVGSAVYAGERLHAPPHADAAPHLGWALATDASSSRAAFERARAAVERLRFDLETPPA